MAAGATYTPLATTTLASDTASYTFSSIPSTYTDLVLVIVGRTARALTADNAMLYCNADSGTTNYSWTYLSGDGTSASSGRVSGGTYLALAGSIAGNNAAAGEYGTAICHIMNYANATTYKTLLSNGGAAGSQKLTAVSLWRGTPAAITSLTLNTITGVNFKAGSTFTLYGIAAA